MAKKAGEVSWGVPVAIAVLVLLGFAWPFFFILAAALFWGAYNTPKTGFDDLPPVTPQPPQQRFDGTAANPHWRLYYETMCESPAEAAFLKAMFVAHDLKPGNDALVGNGLTLALQVDIKPHRVDFVANRKFIIEIDGAQWHSSPEAVERDRVRDEFMRANGYQVLRIPAKVVLCTPQEAVKRVDAYLGRVAKPMVADVAPVVVAAPKVGRSIAAMRAANPAAWAAFEKKFLEENAKRTQADIEQSEREIAEFDALIKSFGKQGPSLPHSQ